MNLRVKRMPTRHELKEARESLHMTQEDLALELGISRRTLQNWESGKGTPRAKHRRALVDFMEAVEAAA